MNVTVPDTVAELGVRVTVAVSVAEPWRAIVEGETDVDIAEVTTSKHSLVMVVDCEVRKPPVGMYAAEKQ